MTTNRPRTDGERAADRAARAFARAAQEDRAVPRRLRNEALILLLVGALLALAVILASRPTDAEAATPVAVDYTEAAAYYGQTVECATVEADQPFMDAWHRDRVAELVAAGLPLEDAKRAAPYPAALAFIGGCRIIVGDYYLAAPACLQAAIIRHEYGHLVGLDDNVPSERDPLGVMSGDVRDGLALCAPAAVAAAAAAPAPYVPTPEALALTARYAADSLRDERATIRWEARQRRSRCMDRANDKPTRAKRVKARVLCRNAYAARTVQTR